MSRRTRTTTEQVNPLAAALAEAKAVIERYDDGINDLIDAHGPKTDASRREHVHPGWDSEVVFYCEKCSTAWPCRMVNDLRALYGKAHEWDEATIPYAPLTLRLDTPENMTVKAHKAKRAQEVREAQRAEREEQRAAEQATAPQASDEVGIDGADL